ncbi:tyrosine-type recombinase/integrase [Flavobacterium sp. WC2416]|uniref:Tyrosine-type recombinase/integrase n=1 Tax=Flavobacterium sp. WC2416 TaxID=3234141 RepID=A0AB39W5M8_9FLAO
MKYTFKLKEPNSDKETLILFSCFFKDENKKFIYSTGEKIHPKNWDAKNKFPFQNGKDKAPFFESIKIQLNRYSDLMQITESERKKINEPFTQDTLKRAFDEEFKRTPKGKNIFFEKYDEFFNEKIGQLQWTAGTKTRYQNIRNILERFEIAKNYPLTFNRIDEKFHIEFTDYSLNTLKHVNNTYLRNLTFFKTFMNWAIDRKYTYNEKFKKFNIDDSKKHIIKETATSQIALTIEDLNKIMGHTFKTKSLERVRDVFVFACVTGMRFGELSLISKSNVTETHIVLKEEKGVFKEPRNIPLTTLSKYILAKYDYQLPLIANQKQNKYLKDAFQEMEFLKKIEKATNRGREVERTEDFFYNRITTHTARRTFITMMKRKGVSDKLIAKATGHKDMATLNKYYQVDDEQTKEAMDEVFSVEIPLKKII